MVTQASGREETIAARMAARVPSMLAYMDTDLRYAYANRAYHRWLGVQDDHVVGRLVQDVLGPTLFATLKPHLMQALNGVPQRFERHEQHAEPEERRSFLIRYTPDLDEEATPDAGRIAVRGIVVEVQDVTELREAEHKLRDEVAARSRAADMLARSEEELREAQRLGRLGSWTWEVEADIVTWSEQLYRMFGQDPSRLPPPFAEHRSMVPERSWDKLCKAVTHCLNTGDGYVTEIEYLRPDGTRGWAEVRGESVRDEGGRIVGLRGTSLDVSDRRDVERRLKHRYVELARRSMMGSLAFLSERVRQFLNSTMGIATVLRRHPDDAAQRDRWLDHIIVSGDALAEVFSEQELTKLQQAHLAAAMQNSDDHEIEKAS